MKSASGHITNHTLPRDTQPGEGSYRALCGNTGPTEPRRVRATGAASITVTLPRTRARVALRPLPECYPSKRCPGPRKLSRLRRLYRLARRGGYLFSPEAVALYAICLLTFLAFAWPALVRWIGGAL